MTQKFRKGDQVRYAPRCGGLCSAVVRRVHRDGDATVEARFSLDDDGRERVGYLGFKFRLPQSRLSAGA